MNMKTKENTYFVKLYKVVLVIYFKEKYVIKTSEYKRFLKIQYVIINWLPVRTIPLPSSRSGYTSHSLMNYIAINNHKLSNINGGFKNLYHNNYYLCIFK